MSAAPQELLRESDECERPASAFWQWFALGVLALCWIAEGTLCAACGS